MEKLIHTGIVETKCSCSYTHKLDLT